MLGFPLNPPAPQPKKRKKQGRHQEPRRSWDVLDFTCLLSFGGSGPFPLDSCRVARHRVEGRHLVRFLRSNAGCKGCRCAVTFAVKTSAASQSSTGLMILGVSWGYQAVAGAVSCLTGYQSDTAVSQRPRCHASRVSHSKDPASRNRSKDKCEPMRAKGAKDGNGNALCWNSALERRNRVILFALAIEDLVHI